MRGWLRQLGPALIAGLWYVFGVLIYHCLRRQPPPSWHELPDYLATLAGFVAGCATLLWWRKRKKNTPER